MLVRIADRLAREVGPNTVLARVGGDEFTALLPHGISRCDSQDLVRRLQRTVAEPLELGGCRVLLSMSVGVAFGDSGDTEQIMIHADLAMHAAKAAGRASARDYRPGMGENMDRYYQSVKRFRQALADNEFAFEFQPIVDLADQPTSHCREALLRWRTPAGEQILCPTEILATATYLAELQRLTAYSVDEVIATAAGWQAEDSSAVALNLNPQQLDLPDLLPMIDQALATHRLPAGQLVIEVTEQALLSSSACSSVLPALRERGVRIALDDFGVGYSNFSRLGELDIDELKVDRSLLSLGGTPELTCRRNTVLQAVVDLAHRLKLIVTLEGVETPEQLELARQLGVDQVQGFLVGPPVPDPNRSSRSTSAHSL